MLSYMYVNTEGLGTVVSNLSGNMYKCLDRYVDERPVDLSSKPNYLYRGYLSIPDSG